jgi:hypothetical protein
VRRTFSREGGENNVRCLSRILVCLLAVVLFNDCRAWSQGGTAAITGTVSDTSGAVLPGVEVTATNTGTGIGRAVITNEAGAFVLPNLPVGPYRLQASLAGFRSFAQTGIVLQVNSSPVVNIRLEVGTVTQSIEVQANASMVETRATGVGEVIDNNRIAELPLVGRQVQDLVVLAGAAVQTGISNNNSRSFPGVATFSIAGGLSAGTSFTLDGASHNEARSNLGYPLPFPDALQEFKVETSAVPAQYGFRSGGAVNAVTKSGTNDFHGDAFWFVRNNIFNARNFFSDVRDNLKRNQFGGTLGGPIKKNRLFFFGAYQGTTTRQNSTGSTSFVPTPAMIQGDFSKFASAACQGTALRLPAPFVNNVAPQSVLSPAAVALAQRLPAAVDDCGTTHWGTAVKRLEGMYIGKVDYQITNNHSMFWRLMLNPYKEDPPYSVVHNPLATQVRGVDNMFYSGTVGDTITFRSNLVNTLRLGWNRERIQGVSPAFFDVSDLGINAYHIVPKIITVSVSQEFSVGSRTASPNSYNETGYQFSDDVGLVKGSHQFNFGGSWMAFQTNNNSQSGPIGQWAFNGDTTGNAMADFILGKLTTLTQGGPNFNYVRTKPFALYMQDSWKVRPKVTLNLGLRWEPYLAQKFERKESNYFDIAAFVRGERTAQYTNAPAGIFYPGDPQFLAGGNSSNPVRNQWNRWAPRLGFSWDPKGTGLTVIRAAYGILYDTQTSDFNLTVGQGAPWAGLVSVQNPIGGFDDPYRGFPGGNPFPFVPNRSAPYPQSGVYATTFAGTSPPYVQQWNVSVQRQIRNNWLMSASYLGNEVTHVYGAVELNPGLFIPGNADANGLCFTTAYGQTVSLRVNPNAVCSTTANVQQRRVLSLLDPAGTRGGPKYANIEAWDSNGTRSYNGLMVSVDKRMSGNFSFTANYTLSHCIGNPINTLLNGRPGAGVFTDPANRDYDRGNCDSDVRHLANATGLFQMPRFSNPLVEKFAGNWRVSGILRTRSGAFVSPTVSTDRALTGVNTLAQRPDQVSAGVYGSQCKTDLRSSNPTCRWFDANAFAQPGLGTYGNAGAYTLVGPGQWTIDAGLSRMFSIDERQKVEFRAEATNVLNHTNLTNPGATLGASFGRITTAADPRIMQFSLTYRF